jgi:hypothetical protein
MFRPSISPSARNVGVLGRGVEAGDLFYPDIPPGLVARQCVITANQADAHDRAKRLGELAHIVFEFNHATREGHQNRIRRGARVAGFKIRKSFVGIVGDTGTPTCADRNAARKGRFVEQKHFGTGVMRFNRADSSSEAIPNHDNIECFNHGYQAWFKSGQNERLEKRSDMVVPLHDFGKNGSQQFEEERVRTKRPRRQPRSL